MKLFPFIQTVIAASAVSLAAMAQDNLEPLIFEMNMNQISCNGQPCELEDIENIAGNAMNDYIVIMSDTQTQAIMVLALMDAIQSCNTADISVIVPGSSLLEHGRYFEAMDIYPRKAIDIAPLTNEQYYEDVKINLKEYGDIPVFTLNEEGVFFQGQRIETANASNRISGINDGKFAPVVIVKAASSIDIRDLYNFEEYVYGELLSLERADKVRVLYAFPDTRVTEACLIEFLHDTVQEFVVKTVEENDPALAVKPVFNGGSMEFNRYLQSIINTSDYKAGEQGRVFFEYTVMFDGSLGDVKIIQGFEYLHKAFYNAAAKMPALWTPGRTSDGKLVNVHYRIAQVHVEPHL